MEELTYGYGTVNCFSNSSISTAIRKTIRRMIGNGSLPASKLGNHTWRIRACDVDEYVSNSHQNKPMCNNAGSYVLDLEMPERPRLISLFSGCGEWI